MQNILVKSQDGTFKVLKNGVLEDVVTSGNASPQSNSSVQNVQNNSISSTGTILTDTGSRNNEDEEIDTYNEPALQQRGLEVKKLIREMANKVLLDSGVTISDTKKNEACINLLVIGLKGIRNMVDMKKILTDTKQGFSFLEEEALKILHSLKKYQLELSDKQLLVERVFSNGGNHNEESSVIVGKKNNERDTTMNGLKKVRETYMAADYNATSSIKNLSKSIDKSVKTSEIKSVEKMNLSSKKDVKTWQTSEKSDARVGHNVVHLAPPANPVLIKTKSDGLSMVDVVNPDQARAGYGGSADRPNMVDARVSRLIGPIEELQYMTTIDFRRLAEDVLQRGDKILEKIRLLEERSYIDKIKGMQAWQSSDVYSLYVELAHESLTQGKPLENIIDERKRQHKEYLSKDEFFEILNLNQKLSL